MRHEGRAAGAEGWVKRISRPWCGRPSRQC